MRCPVPYHAIVVNDFTIATRKWAKLYKLKESDNLSPAQKMIYFRLAEGKLAEACMHFTTRGLTAGVFGKSFQALTDFMWLHK